MSLAQLVCGYGQPVGVSGCYGGCETERVLLMKPPSTLMLHIKDSPCYYIKDLWNFGTLKIPGPATREMVSLQAHIKAIRRLAGHYNKYKAYIRELKINIKPIYNKYKPYI